MRKKANSTKYAVAESVLFSLRFSLLSSNKKNSFSYFQNMMNGKMYLAQILVSTFGYIDIITIGIIYF